ncbi:MAG: histidinol-phosphate transaminase [bacterium]|nr:histidinol-phosphate transaminase [bacterium]
MNTKLNNFEEYLKNIIEDKFISLNRYKAGKPIEEIKREIFKNKKVKILKLASNENLTGVDKTILKQLQKELKNIYYYPDDSLYYLLNELEGFYKIKKENIVVGNGAVELIRYIYQILVKKGDKIFIPHPSFAIYYIDANLFEAQLITYNLMPPDFDIKYEDIKNNLDKIDDPIKLLIICSPNNPTGSIIFKSDLEKVLNYALNRNIIVILDEAYFEFVDNENYHNGLELLKEYPNLIVLRTFSKVFALAGLRIGIAFTNQYISRALNNIRLPFNVNTLAQKATILALKNYNTFVDKIKLIINQKYFLYSKLEQLKKEFNIDYIKTYSNFIAIRVKDANKVFNELLLEGIIVRPASDMNLGDYIRVTISPFKSHNELFIKKLKKVLKKI